ncbi:MAG: hypothetical protein ACREFK_01595 [Stellaceae bacterium]
MIAKADIAVVRGLQRELLAAAERMQQMISRDPRALNDPVFFAYGQLNSAVRYLEVAVLKAGGDPAEPPIIG